MVRIGFTCGAFDLVHAGHVLMFEEAKTQCDWLIVGLHTDPTIDRKAKNKPSQSIFERYLQLKACRWVDEIIPYDTEHDLINLLGSIPIDLRIVGADYLDKDFTGKGLHKVYYNTRQHDFSTTELRKRLCKS